MSNNNNNSNDSNNNSNSNSNSNTLLTFVTPLPVRTRPPPAHNHHHHNNNTPPLENENGDANAQPSVADDEKQQYVPLHVHSDFSLLDGASQLPTLVVRAQELGLPTLALTDHGVLYGAIQLVRTCANTNVKPIIGNEMYVFNASLPLSQPHIAPKRYELRVNVIATNDSHFTSCLDAEAHDAMICIQTGRLLSDDNRLHYAGNEYFKSVDEVRQCFADHLLRHAVDIPLRNTLRVADKIVEYDLVAARRLVGTRRLYALHGVRGVASVAGRARARRTRRCGGRRALRAVPAARIGYDLPHGLFFVFPRRVGLHQTRAPPAYSRRTRLRLRRRMPRRLRAAYHQR